MRLLAFFSLMACLTFGHAQGNPEFAVGEIIIKIKPEYRNKCQKTAILIPEIEATVQKNAITGIQKLFPEHQAPSAKSQGTKLVDLSTMYVVKIDPLANTQKIIAEFKNNKSVLYAEEKVINEVTYTPNDTLLGSQWYIGAVDLFRAWDIQQGDTNVVIAFTDTGTDTDHPDMVDNYAYNYNDPVNGVDDDGDGYIDNFLGWDVADNDNDAGFGLFGHGINVGGLIGAVTDNITGISGAGFKTKLLPIKIDQSSTGQLTAAYEGIVYAADQGAFIITNSWGSTVYRQYAQDIVNYAALNKGCLVIAATGNNGFENRFYPAAYENVLSVGSLSAADTVKANSNFGYWADIMAPGENMLTTNAIGGYGVNGGTSMAAPVVAGIAGLVKAQFPNYTWQQVTEQILNNGDNIDRFNPSSYAGKIGVGRVNAFRAVSDSSKPGIIFQNKLISDKNDETFLVGDTLRISGAFMNWLKSATNVSINITTIGNKLQSLNSNLNIGGLNSLDSVSIRNNPFEFVINQGVGFNELIEFEINISADNYSKKQYFATIVNIDYLTIEDNNLRITLSSDGGLGYAGLNSAQGEGIKFRNGNSLLYEGSLLIGASNGLIANKFRAVGSQDSDFDTQNPIRSITAKSADYEYFTSFNYVNNASNQLIIENKCYVYDHPLAQNSIVYEYKITNQGSSTYNNLYAGLIMDWDIFNFSNNRVRYDPVRHMGISYATDSNLFCAVRPVLMDTSLSTTHYGIDNIGGGAGGVDISNNNFTDAEKYQVLSTNRGFAGAGSPSGNDILDVNSIGPVTLRPGEHFFASFIVSVGESLQAVEIESDTVKNLYEEIVLSNRGIQNNNITNNLLLYPNPASNLISVSLDINRKDNLSLTVFDLKGRSVVSIPTVAFQRGRNTVPVETSELENGIYILEIEGEELLLQQKFIVAH